MPPLYDDGYNNDGDDHDDCCYVYLQRSAGSGWLSMRLNKDPPDDAAVVEFVGVADGTTPISLAPLSSYNRTRAGGGFLQAVGGGGDAGAGGGRGAGTAPVAASSAMVVGGAPAVQEDDQAMDLRKIKGEPLGEDDHCVVCLSGE